MCLRYSSWKLTLCSEKLTFWEAVLCRVFPSNIWECLLCFEGIPLKSPFIANAFARTIGRTVKNRQPPFLSNKGPSWTWRWLFFNFPLKSMAKLNSSYCYFTISLHTTFKQLFHCLDSSSLSGTGREPKTLQASTRDGGPGQRIKSSGRTRSLERENPKWASHQLPVKHASPKTEMKGWLSSVPASHRSSPVGCYQWSQLRSRGNA